MPLFGGTLLIAFGRVQINSWKCNREAKKQGYLHGNYIPPNRVGVGEACICEEKLRPDGTVDSAARLVIDLWNTRNYLGEQVSMLPSKVAVLVAPSVPSFFERS